ncbi:MAG: DNA translocase FtsK 4TM domain-containing protein [Bacteroidota bacterium]|nr:DNA translocase FtsK 4TM domain-containing protein [Bacteroidota bacterium]
MAKKRKTRGRKKKPDPIDVQIVDFFQSPKTRMFLAISFLLLAIAFLISYISFLNTWKLDQSVLDKGVFEYIFDTEIEVQNAVGKLGLALSHLFVYNMFGIPAVSFTLLFLVFTLRLIGVERISYSKIISNILFYTLWLSITLAFFEESGNHLLGGKLGNTIGIWMISVFGKILTGFILVSSLVMFLFYTSKRFEGFARSLFSSAVAKTRDLSESKLSAQKTNDLNAEYDKESPFKSKPADGQDTNESGSSETKQTEKINYKLDDGGQKLDDDFEVHNTISDEEEEEEDINQNGFTPKQENLHSEQDQSSMKTKYTLNSKEDLYGTIKLDVNSNEEVLAESINNKPQINFDPKLDLSNYNIPDINLLENRSQKFEINNDELIRNKKKIITALKNFNIEITKIKATVGPTITLYEIVPKAGVRISKIKNLEDDIALNLAALGIRIIAPMPGRGTIGIEVPNENPQIVSLRSVIRSKKFQDSSMELPIALGKTISNEAYVFDLAKMPHLLVAGATGQGKSVGLNVIMSSILYKKHPAEVKFVLVDPKKVEMTQFERINKHFLATLPNNDSDELIVTDNKKVLETVTSLNAEMDNRYQILKKAKTRNIKEYNAKFVNRKLNPEKGHRFLPYIVLIIDEFADLIMTAGKEIEQPIARLAQLARAIGIHLVVATQRPSTNIITGAIKANFPGRVAFKVASMIDSRTIIDSPGANRLVGRGDMLITKGNDLIRLQCAFVDTPELDNITEYIESQQGYPMPYLLPEVESEEDTAPGEVDLADRDELFEDAARIIVMNRQGSTSLIQRKMAIGYNRAGRIVDQLEKAGIVGPARGSKPRHVQIQDEYSLEQLFDSLP